jgi:hypothetical protein
MKYGILMTTLSRPSRISGQETDASMDVFGMKLRYIPLPAWCCDTLLSRSSAKATNSIRESGEAGQEPSHRHQVVTATNTDHSHTAVSVRRFPQPMSHRIMLACSSRSTIEIEAMFRDW